MPDERPTAEEVRESLAAIRNRIEDGIQDDEEALKVLERVWPAEWENATLAVVWMLGNAARFGHPYAQDWLDRLVHPNGEPKEDPTALLPLDREKLREIGTLLDNLDANLGDAGSTANLLTKARLSYLGGYCAGLADRT